MNLSQTVWHQDPGSVRTGAGGPAIPLPHPSRQSLFISFSPPHTKSFYISTFLHLKSSWSRCFFFAKIYYLGKVPTKCRPSGRCFGVHLFEIFREKIRYFENFDQWSKYCRCRMGDHEVRVFAHHCLSLKRCVVAVLRSYLNFCMLLPK